ncbi:E3 ubiquitin-protein ligase [Drechslerella dactyloides]|uniref:E3 ubiquitin-protein ligase n=1 Tax=Drechslerella dactyloides TaxID=74499 RepID=A0AAD6NIZ6_DREDA|nr:E3 ubiquitin-protein ligase [Drechslerella dactyloides]
MPTQSEVDAIVKNLEFILQKKVNPKDYFDPGVKEYGVVTRRRAAAAANTKVAPKASPNGESSRANSHNVSESLKDQRPQWKPDTGQETHFLCVQDWLQQRGISRDWEQGSFSQIYALLAGHETIPGANFRTVAALKDAQEEMVLAQQAFPDKQLLLTLAHKAYDRVLESFYGFLNYNERAQRADPNSKIRFGHLDGIPVGKLIASRSDTSALGLHIRQQGSVHARKADGCFSLLIAAGYSEDGEDGDAILFTGVGGAKGEKRKNPPASIDQVLRDVDTSIMENAALVKSHETGWPVRVIIGAKSNISYRPEGEKEYLYIGLFRVHEVLHHQNRGGHNIMRFRLVYFDAETADYIRERRFTIEQSKKAGEPPAAKRRRKKTA